MKRIKVKNLSKDDLIVFSVAHPGFSEHVYFEPGETHFIEEDSFYGDGFEEIRGQILKDLRLEVFYRRQYIIKERIING